MQIRRLFILLLLFALLCGCKPIIPTAPTLTPTLASTTTPPTQAPTNTVLSSLTPTNVPILVPRKGPYLILASDPTNLKICWQFNPPAPAALDWGLDETYSLGSIEVAAGGLDDISSVTLTNLLPATHYFYRLRSNGAAVSSSFTTALLSGDSAITFWAYGDSRSGPEIHDAIDAAILNEIGADHTRQTLVFSTGDLMDVADETNLQKDAFDPQWKNSRLLSSEIPIVNVMGNHDGTKLFKKYFPYPYTKVFDWSFDYGPAHFVIIDQYSGGDANSPRWQWLKENLASSTKKWKFIVLHEPGWSAGPHENNSDVQKIIHPLAVRYGVSIIFAGHNHYYARALVDGVTYLTTGGAGAPLYDPENGWPNIIISKKADHYLRVEINGDTLTLTALTPQGDIIDQFTLNR